MKTYINPQKNDWASIIARPELDLAPLRESVGRMLDSVRKRGDEAIHELTLRFDGVQFSRLAVTEDEIAAANRSITPALKQAIELAASNIRRFHEVQGSETVVVETMPGVKCWRKQVPIEQVGLYVPGGSAPLFSTVLMLAIPAQLAGCSEIILCTPPSKDGTIHPAILYAAQLSGVRKIFRAGGVQAIGGMAYGTQSIPSVSKIFGPGNQYVNCAKQLVQLDGIAIDMPAGPSEVCIWADASAQPEFVAADLLSQAEHGPDSQVILVTDSGELLNNVKLELDRQIKLLTRSIIAEKAMQNSAAILVKSAVDAVELVNAYAPEHLILNCRNAGAMAEKVINAGSVFIGPYSPESAGDYASGTNHTLPTNGFARAYSGVSLDSFVRKITFQEISREGLELIGPAVMEMARAEGLDAHREAVNIRLNQRKSNSNGI